MQKTPIRFLLLFISVALLFARKSIDDNMQKTFVSFIFLSFVLSCPVKKKVSRPGFQKTVAVFCREPLGIEFLLSINVI
jgi:hypothetical protein